MSTEKAGRWRVFNLPRWQAELSRGADWPITVGYNHERPWAVVPPCEAGCQSAHNISWEGEAYGTWDAAMAAAAGRSA